MTWRLARTGALLCSLLLVPAVASAQIYGSVSAGANHTASADVTVTVPSAGLGVTYHDVQFSARPFGSPQYYVWRLGRLFGPTQRVGLEFEFTHLKVISNTAKAYVASGTIAGLAIPSGTALPMNAEVQEYQMTHGLNFLLVNGIARVPIGPHGRLAFVARGGLGATLPHAETNVLNQSNQHYEFAGVGFGGSAGLAIKLTGILSITADYKISAAQPRITVASGTGQMRAVSQQVAIGLAFGFAR
jgi:hypothetical protein